MPPGSDASLDPEAVADLAADVGRRREGQHLSQRLGAPEEAAGEQRVEEANEVTAGGDEGVPAGGARHRRIDATDVEHLAVHLEVAVRIGAHPRTVPGGRKHGRSEPERPDDAVGHFLLPAATGRVLDDQPEKRVFGVRVGVACARREQRFLRCGEIERLGYLPDPGGITGGGDVRGRGAPVGETASVTEQHPKRDPGCGREAVDHIGGEHVG